MFSLVRIVLNFFYTNVEENVMCRLTTFSSLTLSADFLFHLAPLNKNMIEICRLYQNIEIRINKMVKSFKACNNLPH